MTDIIQADIDLCVELNIPDHQAHVIARHRLAQIAAIEEPSPELVKAVARDFTPAFLEYLEGYDEVPPNEVWSRPRYEWIKLAVCKQTKAALAAAALHLKSVDGKPDNR